MASTSAVVHVTSPRPHPLATEESKAQLRAFRSKPENAMLVPWLWNAIEKIPMDMYVALDTWLALIEEGELAPILRPLPCDKEAAQA